MAARLPPFHRRREPADPLLIVGTGTGLVYDEQDHSISYHAPPHRGADRGQRATVVADSPVAVTSALTNALREQRKTHRGAT